jgi:NADH-quinone oxidoreductase subunit G
MDTTKLVTVQINNQSYQIAPGTTILDACRQFHIYIPVLCYHSLLPPAGKCGICVVRIDGNTYVYTCMQPVRQGMTIDTNTPDVMAKALTAFVSFLERSIPPPSPELEEICRYLMPKRTVRTHEHEVTHAITFDPILCVNCGRCMRICADIQGIGALNDPNPRRRVNECISCGQCLTVCPTKALVETSSIPSVLKALCAGRVMILQLAPAVRTSVGELFGEPIGTRCTGKIIAAARRMGFKYVLDVAFAADVTVWEEGNELLDRLKNGGVLPMFTSCCPAWVNLVERLHPQLIRNLSTAKSPHLMLARLIRTYFADRIRIKPEQIFVVSLMPCTAKKDEIKRMQHVGDVNAVLTVREFGSMCEEFGIEWKKLQDEPFDSLSTATASAVQFGVSGGVAEAAVRYCYTEVTKQKLGALQFEQFGSTGTIQCAEVQMGNALVKVAICNGSNAARELVESDRYKGFHLIEVMACAGGCIVGAGQPILRSRKMAQARRATILMQIPDSAADNREVRELYRTFLGHPGSHRAHELLHTHYEPQESIMLAHLRQARMLPVVAYGSSSGTAMRFARVVGGLLGTASVAADTLSVASLVRRRTAIFIVSTIGDGDFPTNCKRLATELREAGETLQDVKFAVCGLGKSSFSHFCRAGQQYDEILQQARAVQMLPFTTVDTGSDDRGEAAFERWLLALCATMNLPRPKIGLTMLFSAEIDTDDSVVDTPMRPLSFEIGTLRETKRLSQEGSPIINQYAIKLPVGMSYQAGHVADILPENAAELTNSVLKALNFPPDEVFKVTQNGMTMDNIIPQKVTARQLFSQYLDLTGPPPRTIFRAFLNAANEKGQHKIAALMDHKDEEKLKAYLKQKKHTAGVVCDLAQFGIPGMDALLSSIPQIRPRTYQIVSTPLESRGIVQIVVRRHTYGPIATVGMCSGFLELPQLRRVALRIRPGQFRPPDDRDTPIIMVGIGIGVFAFKALIEDRDPEHGSVMLVYGTGSRERSELFVRMFETLKEKGHINDLMFAFSRDEAGKGMHVQDRLRQNTTTIWKYWQDPTCRLFYAGPWASVADDIKQILLETSMSQGNVNEATAQEFNASHQFTLLNYGQSYS